MRIAFSGFVLDNGRSGIATYVLELLRSLSDLDKANLYDVIIANKSLSIIPPLGKNFSIVTKNDFLEDPFCNILWHNSIFPFLARFKDYKILHVPTIRRVPYVKGCKVVATVHDLAPFVVQKKYDRLRMFYHHHILKKWIERCDHIIAVSEATKIDILRFTEYPEEKISVIYSGINQDIFHQIEKQVAQEAILKKYGINTPFFVYVSRIEHPGKNHMNLIRAFEEFKRRYKSSHRLLLAGADWSGASLVKEEAQKSPYAKDIRFLGFVSTPDIPLLYSSCDLMIYPSSYEGFGFPVLEALACGARVVCSEIPSLLEIAKGHVYFCDPMNWESIAAGINHALKNSDFLDRAEGIKHALSFDWKITAKEVLSVYHQVANE